MTRQAWLAERPFRERYLRLLEGGDYTERDGERIKQFYLERGWGEAVTSQDASRCIAALELGKIRLTTFPCHARYIGKVGLHSTEALYEHERFGSSVFFPIPPSEPLPPSDEQMEAWLEDERKFFSIGKAVAT